MIIVIVGASLSGASSKGCGMVHTSSASELVTFSTEVQPTLCGCSSRLSSSMLQIPQKLDSTIKFQTIGWLASVFCNFSVHREASPLKCVCRLYVQQPVLPSV